MLLEVMKEGEMAQEMKEKQIYPREWTHELLKGGESPESPLPGPLLYSTLLVKYFFISTRM